jgi:8-oxo-dGTP pyrophosphatase MutT (NUDIX family)
MMTTELQSRAGRRLHRLLDVVFSRRPPQLQVGALCLRGKPGRREVLLVSSLDSGRWIIPKGWPMRGRTLAEAALREAWEEAGVEGEVGEPAFGTFTYLKRRHGLPRRSVVHVFVVRVSRTVEDYPEAARRKRRWMRPAEAAGLVEESGLKALLRGL